MCLHITWTLFGAKKKNFSTCCYLFVVTVGGMSPYFGLVVVVVVDKGKSGKDGDWRRDGEDEANGEE